MTVATLKLARAASARLFECQEVLPQRQPTPIYVVSDLHLGDGGPRDNFAVAGRMAQFHSFLDRVAEQRGRLIILGDLFEFWQANLSRVVMRHVRLLDRLAEMRAVPPTCQLA